MTNMEAALVLKNLKEKCQLSLTLVEAFALEKGVDGLLAVECEKHENRRIYENTKKWNKAAKYMVLTNAALAVLNLVCVLRYIFMC